MTMSQPIETPAAPLEWVTIKTTLPKPYPLMADREPIRTERLILRPFAATDLDGFHALRLQPEVMKWTMQGKPDVDRDQTAAVLASRLPGTDGEKVYEFVVCCAKTGTMIGTAGSHMKRGEFGWPVIGYMIRSEHWGKGLATEIVRGLLQRYWSLPREEVELEVEKSTVKVNQDGEVDEVQPECIVAITDGANRASQNVLTKCGFRLSKVFTEEDEEHGDQNLGASLWGYFLKKPEDLAN